MKSRVRVRLSDAEVLKLDLTETYSLSLILDELLKEYNKNKNLRKKVIKNINNSERR